MYGKVDEMNKSRILLLSFICIFLIFFVAGCNDECVNSDKSTFPDIEFKYNLVNWEKNINFNGEPVSLTFEINNNEGGAEFGLMVFIDGKIQKFITTENNELSYMHSYYLETKQNKSIQISLLPQGFDIGEYDLTVLVMLNPSFMAEAPNYVFGYNHKISYAYTRIRINTETDIKTKTGIVDSIFEISSVEKNRYIRDGINQLEQRAYSIILNNEEEENRKIILNKKDLKIEFKILGGSSATYRITAFLNHEPILINDEYSDFLLQSSLDNYSILNLNYKNEQLEGNSVFYIIAIPINEIDEYAYPVKSDSIVIIK